MGAATVTSDTHKLLHPAGSEGMAFSAVCGTLSKTDHILRTLPTPKQWEL